ncbi:hypothetical protein A3K86_07170 [Photobacterium jeanii]|uniref:ABC transporter substrate-binding protein n=1 Tax=Photobacterium jeanii TaxID=858640 RepID=A0A178KMT4_9GAMM|nr:ABC transporter substrate-binding protein [Photobacterium jeanii]OAN18659.1 hypothetical protein A3K86_07170 [Photobacterium jeanii]PST91661.1 ABC transporter substrate-binding protein [Photobacterium jeanii]
MCRILIFLLLCLPTAVLAYNTPVIVLTTFEPSALEKLVEKYQAQYPNVALRVLHRHEDAAQRLLNDPNHDIDVVISSSLSLFSSLQQKKQLKQLPTINKEYASQQAKVILKQFDKQLALLGYSSYGFMWNQRYLEKHNLDRPSSWQSLTHPQYFRHIVMAAPSRSVFSHYMIESILQQYGWDDGWHLLYQLSGNLASVSMLSATDDISRGRAGIAPVADIMAYRSQQPFPFIGFSYQPNSPVIPAFMASIENRHNAANSAKFISFLESVMTQMLHNINSHYSYVLRQARDQRALGQQLDFALLNKRSAVIKKLYTHSVSHTLALHNKAWKLIHDVSNYPFLTPEQRQNIDKAIKLATTPPLTEQQAMTISANVKARPNIDVQSYNDGNPWCVRMHNQLTEAIKITEQIVMDYEAKTYG